MSADQKSLAEQNQQIAELESERQMLKDQVIIDKKLLKCK